MSTVLKFSICQANDCESMVFTETTGAYSSTNLTGWGTPNLAVNTAVTAVLYVTDPSNVTTILNLFSVTQGFPTIDNTLEFEILPSALGMGTKFTDGLYKFKYYVTFDDEGSIETTAYQFFYCSIQCCVNKMFAKITDPTCDCQADAIAAASKADALLTGLIKAAKCGKTSVFNSLMAILTKLCTNINCDTCS